MSIESPVILLISCYELGHQPLGIAWSAGFLKQAGYHCYSLDLAVSCPDSQLYQKANFVVISVPMHTALRLGINVARNIRKVNPNCHICFVGLYAAMNQEYLLKTVADTCLGGEYEETLVHLIEQFEEKQPLSITSKISLERQQYVLPDRSGFPDFNKYASLQYRGGEFSVGYVESTRGCKHLCRHCPIPPVYEGKFVAVPRDIVLEDIENLVNSGAQHITFGDPDFLNGPRHAERIIHQMHQQFPELTFDFTTKVEHILKYPDTINLLSQQGGIFVVSAVESFDNEILEHLQKGHTCQDIVQAIDSCRQSKISIRPTLVAFTPWTTLDNYLETLRAIEKLKLIDEVDPVQYSIRLLIPSGSLLENYAPIQPYLSGYDEERFTYLWNFADAQMEAFYQEVRAIVTAMQDKDDAQVFSQIKATALTYQSGKVHQPKPLNLKLEREKPPRLSESWFCCAEPTEEHFAQISS